VALTRAKSRSYVIGDRKDRKSFPGFDILAEELRVVSV
jgi:superfamily I DNA and/or RNA helicase